MKRMRSRGMILTWVILILGLAEPLRLNQNLLRIWGALILIPPLLATVFARARSRLNRSTA